MKELSITKYCFCQCQLYFIVDYSLTKPLLYNKDIYGANYLRRLDNQGEINIFMGNLFLILNPHSFQSKPILKGLIPIHLTPPCNNIDQ